MIWWVEFGDVVFHYSLNERAKGYDAIYALHMPNSVEPALLFDPILPGTIFKHCVHR